MFHYRCWTSEVQMFDFRHQTNQNRKAQVVTNYQDMRGELSSCFECSSKGQMLTTVIALVKCTTTYSEVIPGCLFERFASSELADRLTVAIVTRTARHTYYTSYDVQTYGSILTITIAITIKISFVTPCFSLDPSCQPYGGRI